MNALAVLKQLTTEEKIKLCSGADLWHLESFPDKDIPQIMMTDGPHGLRKQVGDGNGLGLADSIPATCFPTASLSACSWDKALMFHVGQALAEEALAQKVSVILGPGVNIKRNAKCGRNFEYFSEDPYLSGMLAAAMINGTQSMGIGTSIKHFAANNQETRRMSSSSNLDERTLRELYLKPFEIAIKYSRPWTVMASYNKINGVHSSSNPWLLNTVLREEWGFDGVVVSDWGAAHERPIDLKAGEDLEMPGNNHYYLEAVKAALADGSLTMKELDQNVLRILQLIEKAEPALSEDWTFDQVAHRGLARKVAQESIVLLKNEDKLLPLDPAQPILVLGEFAEKARIQGSGSSKVHPLKTETFLDGLAQLCIQFSYRQAYDLKNGQDLTLVPDAIEAIQTDQPVVILVGLTEDDEIEGFDRPTLAISVSHHALIEAVLEKTSKVIVILVGGAPYEIPWADRVSAILAGYLPGEAGGPALADILFGAINPSGKLAETWQLKEGDAPSDLLYGVMTKEVTYRECLFVGYRYFDSAREQVAFPFGHGLSYTEFEYKDLSFTENVLSFTLTNIGERTGSEVIQVYLSNQTGVDYFPVHELKAFEKITLKAHESKVIHLALNESAFQHFDSTLGRFVCAQGTYEIQVGSSSRDIRLSLKIDLKSPDPQHIETHWKELWVDHLQGQPTDLDFEALTGMAVKPQRLLAKGEFNLDSAISDMDHLLIGKAMKVLSSGMLKKATQTQDTDSADFKVMMAMVLDMPLRNTMLMSQGQFPPNLAYAIIDIANGHWITGLRRLLSFYTNQKKAS